MVMELVDQNNALGDIVVLPRSIALSHLFDQQLLA